MDIEYCFLYSGSVGGIGLLAARMVGHEAFPEDMVILDGGALSGHIVKRIFLEDGGEEYAFFADFIPIHEITAVYHHGWSKGEPDERHP